MKNQNLPSFVGKTFVFDYGDLVAHDHFVSDTLLTFEVVGGPFAGVRGEARYEAHEIAPDVWMITWQEADGATVVHVDDFARGISHSNFTDAKLGFHRMLGSLRELAA